jgi:hypothetical protein
MINNKLVAKVVRELQKGCPGITKAYLRFLLISSPSSLKTLLFSAMQHPDRFITGCIHGNYPSAPFPR